MSAGRSLSTSDFLTSLLPPASSRTSRPSSTSDLLTSLLSAGSALVGPQGRGSPLLQRAGQFSPLLQGAGQLVVDNWEPIVQVGRSVLGSRGGGAVAGVAARALVGSAAGLGLTAGVARLGLGLLERRLQARREKKAGQQDPLRGVSSKSRTRTKQEKRPERSGGAPPAAAPLNQLVTLFPDTERSVLGRILASNQGDLEAAVDQVLSLATDCPTPVQPDHQEPSSFPFPPSSSTPSSPLPPCPDCPVCFSPLAGRRIYQCTQGHSLCHKCRDKPQVRCCPTCRGSLVGRATNMEQLLNNIYGTG